MLGLEKRKSSRKNKEKNNMSVDALSSYKNVYPLCVGKENVALNSR